MADYVVTRKRKRYAVDPCLGYYMYAPSSDGVESAAGACSNLANGGIAHAANNTGLQLECTEPALQLMKGSYKSSDKTMQGNPNRPSQDGRRSRAQLKEEDILTVEAFLKSSAKQRATKTYRHRKLLNHKSNASTARSSTTPRRSSTGNNGEDKNFDSNSDSKNTRRRKNRKPLKERLYEAAVLTHGNPDEYYTRSEAAENMASNRTALLFVPYEHASRDRAAGKTHTKALIVDPRKSMAMQTASLTWRPHRRYTDSGLLSNTLDRIPLSKWNLTLNNGGHDKSVGVPTNRKESKVAADMANDYPPLKFVSLQEAEKNYKTMFPGVGILKPHNLTNIVSPLEGANHKTDTHGWSLAHLYFEKINCIDNHHKCVAQVNRRGTLPQYLASFPEFPPFKEETSLPPLLSKLHSPRPTPRGMWTLMDLLVFHSQPSYCRTTPFRESLLGQRSDYLCLLIRTDHRPSKVPLAPRSRTSKT